MDEQYEHFVSTHSSRLLRAAVLMAGERTAGEDLLQDVLVQLYVHWRRIQDPEAYARVVMARRVIDRWRHRERRPQEVPWLPSVDGQLPDASEQRADRATVLDLLAQLPPRQRAVLVLRYFEDWSEAQIAAQLGCSPGTVTSQASKGLARLRQLAPSHIRELSEEPTS